MSPRRSHKFRSFICLPYLITSIIAVFGIGVGTYCWFEYQNRANVTYYGTAVGGEGKMDIGLVSSKRLDGFATTYDMIEDSVSLPDNYIYWTRDNATMTSEAILDYAQRLGHASNAMTATSSGAYEAGGTFELKRAPELLASAEFLPARLDTYTKIRLAFRTDAHTAIFLKGSHVECENDVREAVRVYFNEPDSTGGFIYNPSSIDEGATAVGGILNLDTMSNEYFDYQPAYEYEHIYGEVESVTYDGSKYTQESPIPSGQRNCFVSNHKAGLLIPKITPKYANYLGSYSTLGSKVLTSTKDLGTISYLDATIYLEGWDHTCVEQAISSHYSLNLEFTFKEVLL